MENTLVIELGLGFSMAFSAGYMYMKLRTEKTELQKENERLKETYKKLREKQKKLNERDKELRKGKLQDIKRKILGREEREDFS